MWNAESQTMGGTGIQDCCEPWLAEIAKTATRISKVDHSALLILQVRDTLWAVSDTGSMRTASTNRGTGISMNHEDLATQRIQENYVKAVHIIPNSLEKRSCTLLPPAHASIGAMACRLQVQWIRTAPAGRPGHRKWHHAQATFHSAIP
jgi:hypothetical protein